MIHIIIFSILVIGAFVYTFLKMIKENNTNYVYILGLEFLGIVIDFILILNGKIPNLIILSILYVITIIIPITMLIMEMNGIYIDELYNILKAKKQPDNAKALLLKNINKYPKSYISHKKLAQYYEQNSEMEKAEDEYLIVIGIKPKDYESYCELAKIMHENYGIDIELDFEVYPRGQYDAQDAVVNDWRIDVKGTRQGGHYLLVEWNKLDFRQQEKRLSHVYVMFSVGWDRERDLPNRYVKYAGAITLRALNNNNDWIDTKILRKGECIPGTNARLQADNYGIEFNELNKNLDGLVHTMQNRKPNQNVVDYYLNPYTNDTTIEITRSEEAKRFHIERVKAILSEWERNHQS